MFVCIIQRTRGVPTLTDSSLEFPYELTACFYLWFCVLRPMRPPSEFASTTPMKPSKGDAMSHPITELEASRAVLVQGLPLLDQELTESSIVQV